MNDVWFCFLFAIKIHQRLGKMAVDFECDWYRQNQFGVCDCMYECVFVCVCVVWLHGFGSSEWFMFAAHMVISLCIH